MGFFNIHSVAKHQKIEGGNIYFRKKSRSAEKNERGTFGLARYGMLRGKTGKSFWFSSLGQMVQFGAIIFCRTFKNYFGQFVWIEKKSHYNSRVSLHEAPTKKTSLTLNIFELSIPSVNNLKNSQTTLQKTVSSNGQVLWETINDVPF